MLTYRRRNALTFCSSLAIAAATVAGADAAKAQSFQGNGTFNSGTGTITPGSGTTTIDITSSDAVIDWSTFDTAINAGVPINFQPAGTTATFQSASDFSVLNRILPTDPSRPIQFNGTVIAQLVSASTTTGGTVYFYSPGGLIIGASAVFNVGNLGLTSIAPEIVGGAFEQTDPMTGLEFARFNGAVTPGSAVIIQPGAQITGTDPGVGSYLAIVAPVINQGGSIDGKRVSALVSADAATLTFNPNGLFDIQVSSGTSGTGTTLAHTGSTTGPDGDSGLASRVYLVAVPKNQAITMAIGDGSRLGFSIADSADVVGNAVILSAGHDIAGGSIVSVPSAGSTGGTAQIDSFNSSYTSAVTARATDRALFAGDSVGVGGIVFNGGLTAHSDTIVSLEARNGGNATVVGDLILDADRFAASPTGSITGGNAYLDSGNGANLFVGGNAVVRANGLGGSATGGQASVFAHDNGTITIAGNATVEATAFTSAGGGATGGIASLGAAQGSLIDVAGAMRILAYGIAGTNNGAGGAGGNGQGGNAQVFANTGGDVIANELNVAADGVGGADVGSGAGGSGTGGFAGIFASDAGSTISIASGNVSGDFNLGDHDFISAEGFGGYAFVPQDPGEGMAPPPPPPFSVGGAGVGGTVDVSVLSGATLNGPATTGTFGFVRMIARGTGGAAGTGATGGGQATGGTLNLTVDNATMISAELLPSSFALGGSALAMATGVINGGNAVGGTRNVTVRNGGVLTTSIGGGSAGAVGGNGTDSGQGGDASGGLARLTVDNGTFNVTDRALFFTQNTGGNGGTGGDATGGQVFADILNGGVVNVSVNGPNQQFLVAADNRGGNSFAGPGGAGGNATGGLAQLIVDNGTLDSASVRVSAIGLGGGGLADSGGSGTGGTARLQMHGGSIAGNSLELDATGAGGSIDPMGSGNGGNGLGGFATLEATSGTTTLDFTGIEVRGDGLGGDALGPSGNGGSGSGGAAQLFATNGATLTVNVTEGIVVNVDSTGGFAAGTGNGGNATAGSARVIVNNGTMTLNGDLEIDGGTSGGDGVNGGAAFGNPNPNAANAFIGVNNGTLTVNGFTALDGDISGGDGRDGGDGGDAGIGFAQVFAGDNNGTGLRGTINLQDVLIEASSTGGSAVGSGDGGSGLAGRTVIFVNGGDIAISGNAELEATVTGGDGLNGGDAISPYPFRQPRALIGSFNGTVDIGGFALLTASAFGGNATELGGGQGGIAFAGGAGIDAQSQNGPSEVSVGDLLIDVTANGGFGGEGLSGQAGGAGGDAYGGIAFAQGNAGRGVLTVNGDTFISADAFGGIGGQGGDGGSIAPGGNGGAGGRAIGGGFNIGTVSGFDTPENVGSATFGQVIGSTQAHGGSGGDGGSGTTQGNGGNGGVGFGGFAGILVRGSPATFGDVIFDATGRGGDGGAGTVGGNGGDGYAGDANVTVTQRFNRTERGSLTANNLSFFAYGFGGSGATAGSSFYSAASSAESGFFIRQSDVTLNTFNLDIGGDLAPNVTATILQVQDDVTGIPVPTQVTVAADPFDIDVSQSTINIAGSFQVGTLGEMRVSLDSSNFNVANLGLSASNFVLPATRPATLGTFNVGSSFSISSAFDFLAYANFVLPGSGLFDFDGSVLTGDLTAGGAINIMAGGSVNTGAIDAVNVFVNGPQSVTTLSVDSDGAILLTSAGPVSTGNLTAGGTIPGAGKIAIGSMTGPVTTGSATSTGDLGIQTGGAITTGALIGRDVLLLAGGNIGTGAITALDGTQPTGSIYFGNSSVASSSANVFLPFRGASGMLSIFNSVPVAIGGSATFGGPIQGGSVRGAAQGALSASAITSANFIELTAGGLATVNGAWRSPRIDLISGDITIASTGSLDALSSSGEILLASTNANGVIVGDGQSGTGYVLDNGEFSRLKAGEIAIVGLDTAQTVDMTVGNLSIAGSQLYGAGGAVILATGDRVTETPGGILRVAGAINGTGFAATNEIGLLSGTVELEAVEGSIKISDSANALGGLIYIEADRIHVASNDILLRLRADPLYAGHIADLNTPLPVARPDGVFNALGFEIYPVETFYIQNTGTVQLPAGFLTTYENAEVIAPDVPPTGGVELVINGQFQTSTGTVTGAAAVALVRDDPEPDSEQFAGFSAMSQLNGCLFVGGACANLAKDPIASISSEITVAVTATLPTAPSASAAANTSEEEDGSSSDEGADSEDDGDDAGASPIAPPTPLINTRPLSPSAVVVEPVAGGGNPALLGSAVPEANPQGGTQ